MRNTIFVIALNFPACIWCKNTRLTSRVLYMLPANGSSSFVVLLVLLVLLVPFVVWFSSFVSSVVLLVH